MLGDGRLRWWDPKVQRYLLTFDEERDARTNAEARADSAEARVRELEAELERRGGGRASCYGRWFKPRLAQGR